MLSNVKKELNSFRFTYLPDASASLNSENKDKVSFDELDQVVTQTLSYLQRDLIPKLKQMQGTVQKRNIWLECQRRNQHQNAVFELENDHVAKLIDDDEFKIRQAREDGEQYPQVI